MPSKLSDRRVHRTHYRSGFTFCGLAAQVLRRGTPEDVTCTECKAGRLARLRCTTCGLRMHEAPARVAGRLHKACPYADTPEAGRWALDEATVR